MMVTSEWSPPALISAYKVFVIFPVLCSAEERSDREALVGKQLPPSQGHHTTEVHTEKALTKMIKSLSVDSVFCLWCQSPQTKTRHVPYIQNFRSFFATLIYVFMPLSFALCCRSKLNLEMEAEVLNAVNSSTVGKGGLLGKRNRVWINLLLVIRESTSEITLKSKLYWTHTSLITLVTEQLIYKLLLRNLQSF